MYSFPNLEPIFYSMYSSNCCILICIQVSQEAGKMIWYFQLFKNFPQFVVIYTVKGFSIVNEAELVGFLELFSFSMTQRSLANLIFSASSFSKFNLCCSVPQLCLTPCDPMDSSTPGSPVLHYLLKFAQIHVR